VNTDRQHNDRYFGVCPICRETDGCRNLHKDHWFFCEQHKVKWFAGSNLMSGWVYETEEDWRRNAEKLAAYEVVKPAYPLPIHGDPICQRCGASEQATHAPWCQARDGTPMPRPRPRLSLIEGGKA
jgi:hypothetical protein